MDKKIILSILGNQISAEGEKNKVELITEARLYKKDNVYYIEYDESEISGMQGTKTLISIDDKTIWLQRSGTHESQLILELGKKFINYFETPFGALEMGIYSTRIDYHIGDNSGKLDVKYQMDLGGEYAGSNEFILSYRENHEKSLS